MNTTQSYTLINLTHNAHVATIHLNRSGILNTFAPY